MSTVHPFVRVRKFRCVKGIIYYRIKREYFMSKYFLLAVLLASRFFILERGGEGVEEK